MKNPKQILLVLVVAGLVFAAKKFGLITDNDVAPPQQEPSARDARFERPETTRRREKKPASGSQKKPKAVSTRSVIDQAYRDKKSNVWVEESGVVTKLLRDDNDGKRHQKWLVKIDSGLSLLFAHNIEIAPRVPLRAGDKIEFRGRYEYSDRGGVVHWTHKHPTGYHKGGWIDHKSKRYR